MHHGLLGHSSRRGRRLYRRVPAFAAAADLAQQGFEPLVPDLATLEPQPFPQPLAQPGFPTDAVVAIAPPWHGAAFPDESVAFLAQQGLLQPLAQPFLPHFAQPAPSAFLQQGF